MNYKAIYLAAGTANIDIPKIKITYQDIYTKRDIGGDMLEVDLKPYDILIATPPCNYYSRASGNRQKLSQYSFNTKHLLPEIIKKFEKTGKPFIVENVRNKPLFNKEFTNELQITTHIYYYGRHTYFTNINYIISAKQEKEELIKKIPYKNYKREGSNNVNYVIKEFLEKVLTIKN